MGEDSFLLILLLLIKINFPLFFTRKFKKTFINHNSIKNSNFFPFGTYITKRSYNTCFNLSYFFFLVSLYSVRFSKYFNAQVVVVQTFILIISFRIIYYRSGETNVDWLPFNKILCTNKNLNGAQKTRMWV